MVVNWMAPYYCCHTNGYITRFRTGIENHGLPSQPRRPALQHVSETDTATETFTLTIRGGGVSTSSLV